MSCSNTFPLPSDKKGDHDDTLAQACCSVHSLDMLCYEGDSLSMTSFFDYLLVVSESSFSTDVTRSIYVFSQTCRVLQNFSTIPREFCPELTFRTHKVLTRHRHYHKYYTNQGYVLHLYTHT
jgi:hypothetical protein